MLVDEMAAWYFKLQKIPSRCCNMLIVKELLTGSLRPKAVIQQQPIIPQNNRYYLQIYTLMLPTFN
jgi:hypothetical protein